MIPSKLIRDVLKRYRVLIFLGILYCICTSVICNLIDNHIDTSWLRTILKIVTYVGWFIITYTPQIKWMRSIETNVNDLISAESYMITKTLETGKVFVDYDYSDLANSLLKIEQRKEMTNKK